MTGLCNLSEQDWRDLDRMLDVWARHLQSGQPMTTAQRFDVFGSPNGWNKALLERFFVELDRRGFEAGAKTA